MQRVCRHVAEGCPGCKLIASPYKTQLAATTEAVRRVLAPFTSAPVTPIVPSPQQWGYRERGTFVQEGPRVGLRGAGGKIVDIPACLVLSEAVARRVEELRREECPAGERTVAVAAVGDQVATSLEQNQRLRAPVLQDKGFMYANPMVFGQANRAVAGLIAQHVMRLLGSDPKSPVHSLLELYAGAGTLTLPLALSRRFGRIAAVEVSEAACQLARAAVREQQLAQVEVVCSDVGSGLARLRRQQERFDAAVANPPWHGLSSDVREMLSGPQFGVFEGIRPARVVYVSCNPRTLARDVGHLELLGWRADSVAPFDIMPQTGEAEVVAHLRRQPRRLVEAPPPLFRSDTAAVVDARPHEYRDGASGVRLLAASAAPEAQTWSVLVRGRVVKVWVFFKARGNRNCLKRFFQIGRRAAGARAELAVRAGAGVWARDAAAGGGSAGCGGAGEEPRIPEPSRGGGQRGPRHAPVLPAAARPGPAVSALHGADVWRNSVPQPARRRGAGPGAGAGESVREPEE